ncbi:MAG: ABC transporter ATP-binding protein [Lentisphaerae bacterium]|nr:ABC transporter ATP-binding protein [Lentisphaerota bacterium]
MSLQIKELSFAYHQNRQPVLRNISCTFEPGRFYGIFGANGSGKSSLLKLAAGELDAQGTVELEGKNIASFTPREKALLLAVSAQENELVLPFKVRECIRLGRYVHGDDGNAMVEKLLSEWNVRHLAERPFAELSGGEQQRIKLLRVLAQDTCYLLLDEPAASLDWSRQLELYEKLQHLSHTENRCVIMVCHDLYIAPGFIDEMLLLKNGELLYSGLPEGAAAERAAEAAFDRAVNIKRQAHSVQVSW